jgi:hypothetical protein
LKKRNAKTQDADYFQVKNVVLKYFLYKKLNFKDLNKE